MHVWSALKHSSTTTNRRGARKFLVPSHHLRVGPEGVVLFVVSFVCPPKSLDQHIVLRLLLANKWIGMHMIVLIEILVMKKGGGQSEPKRNALCCLSSSARTVQSNHPLSGLVQARIWSFVAWKT